MNHTPTPWKITKSPTARNIYNEEQLENEGHYVAQTYGENDAEFIVRACNSHEELIKAISEAINPLKSAIRALEDERFNDKFLNPKRNALKRLQETLAKAEGKVAAK